MREAIRVPAFPFFGGSLYKLALQEIPLTAIGARTVMKAPVKLLLNVFSVLAVVFTVRSLLQCLTGWSPSLRR